MPRPATVSSRGPTDPSASKSQSPIPIRPGQQLCHRGRGWGVDRQA